MILEPFGAKGAGLASIMSMLVKGCLVAVKALVPRGSTTVHFLSEVEAVSSLVIEPPVPNPESE